jgi:hypothetical protein
MYQLTITNPPYNQGPLRASTSTQETGKVIVSRQPRPSPPTPLIQLPFQGGSTKRILRHTGPGNKARVSANFLQWQRAHSMQEDLGTAHAKAQEHPGSGSCMCVGGKLGHGNRGAAHGGVTRRAHTSTKRRRLMPCIIPRHPSLHNLYQACMRRFQIPESYP